MLDLTIGFTVEPLKLEYEKMKKDKTTEYLRFCSADILNNERIAFLIYLAPNFLETEEKIISYEMPRLYEKYRSFIGENITKMAPSIDHNHKFIAIDSIILNDYMQNVDVTWASFECMLNIYCVCDHLIY